MVAKVSTISLVVMYFSNRKSLEFSRARFNIDCVAYEAQRIPPLAISSPWNWVDGVFVTP